MHVEHQYVTDDDDDDDDDDGGNDDDEDDNQIKSMIGLFIVWTNRKQIKIHRLSMVVRNQSLVWFISLGYWCGLLVLAIQNKIINHNCLTIINTFQESDLTHGFSHRNLYIVSR